MVLNLTDVSISEELRRSMVLNDIGRRIWMYGAPCVVVPGVLGNLLILLTLSRLRLTTGLSKSATTFHSYQAILAVADLLALTTTAARTYLYLVVESRLEDTDPVACRIFPYVNLSCSHIAVWIVCAMSLDRTCHICCPLKAVKFCNEKATAIATAAISLIMLLMNSPFLWMIAPIRNPVENVTHCTFTTPEHARFFKYTYSWLHLSLYSFLPFVAITASNSVILMTLSNRHRNLEQGLVPRVVVENAKDAAEKSQISDVDAEGEQPQEIEKNPVDDENSIENVREEKVANPSSGPPGGNKRRWRIRISSSLRRCIGKGNKRRADIKKCSSDLQRSALAKTNTKKTIQRQTNKTMAILVPVCVVFLLTTLPSTVLYLYMDLTETYADPIANLLLRIAELLILVNHSANFFIYFLKGKQFRQQIERSLSRRSKFRPVSNAQNSSRRSGSRRNTDARRLLPVPNQNRPPSSLVRSQTLSLTPGHGYNTRLQHHRWSLERLSATSSGYRPVQSAENQRSKSGDKMNSGDEENQIKLTLEFVAKGKNETDDGNYGNEDVSSDNPEKTGIPDEGPKSGAALSKSKSERRSRDQERPVHKRPRPGASLYWAPGMKMSNKGDEGDTADMKTDIRRGSWR